MFFGKKSPHFDFSCRRLFDPEGLDAAARQLSSSKNQFYFNQKPPLIGVSGFFYAKIKTVNLWALKT